MNRNLKALGLALVAALALTAVMASAASAQFTSSATETKLHGVQTGNHEFTAGSGFGGIKCTTATFSGTAKGTNNSSQTVAPTYGGCEDSLGRTVHITKNTLSYEFTVTGSSGGTPTGVVHVTGEIVLTVTTGGTHCTVTIKGPQTNNGIIYHSSGGHVTVTTNATNITSSTSGGFFACGISNGEHKEEGSYTGTTTMEGEASGGGEASISVH